MADLEAQSSTPEFWNDSGAAQQVMQRMAKLRNEVEQWTTALQQLEDNLELAELGDSSLAADLASEAQRLTAVVEKLMFHAMLNGEYDNQNAILAIHAGAGGTDSQDWVGMLTRMYLRWADSHGFKTEVESELAGEEAGLKSITISIKGDWVYGYLKAERGVHRLVRISPFDANNRRHTSFALVEVWPDLETDVDIEINEKDLEIETFRAGGAGGQHVQKNDTAVRIKHLPTGIVVSCQNQRSQLQNMNRAMQVLKARLVAKEQLERDEALAKIKGDHISAEWGNQIRSYVLHPYQLVKDMRTQHETGRVEAVLDGDLDSFMEAYLRYAVGENEL